MRMTRRDALKAVAVAPFLGREAAVLAAGGTRLYCTSASPRWWTAEPLVPGTWTLGVAASLGAVPYADTVTSFPDDRNVARHGVFTRAYLQLSLPPLAAPTTLSGTIGAAIHASQWHRKINGVLALQVVVHQPDTTVRGVALPITADNAQLPLAERRTRIVSGWPLSPVACQAGDVVVVNIGIAANNQSKSIVQSIGFHVYGNQAVDITTNNSTAAGNTWVEFSSLLPLVWP
jgi:hypothetical protein